MKIKLSQGCFIYHFGLSCFPFFLCVHERVIESPYCPNEIYNKIRVSLQHTKKCLFYSFDSRRNFSIRITNAARNVVQSGNCTRNWEEMVLEADDDESPSFHVVWEKKSCVGSDEPHRGQTAVYISTYTYHPASTGYRVTSSLLLLYTHHHVVLHIVDVTHIVQLIQPHLSTSSLLSLSHIQAVREIFFLFLIRQPEIKFCGLFISISFSCQDFPVRLRFGRERNSCFHGTPPYVVEYSFFFIYFFTFYM